MLRLTTLGGLALEGDQGLLTGAGARPRSLALLALIAATGSRGMSRDKVMSYLWPESDLEHARNCLKQTLFALRHQLQHDLFAPGVSVLRLAPCTVGVDCWEFEYALKRRVPAGRRRLVWRSISGRILSGGARRVRVLGGGGAGQAGPSL